MGDLCLGLNLNTNCKGIGLQLLQTYNEEEVLYQASSKRKMKKHCSTRSPFERENEEELLSEACSKRKMKKNCCARLSLNQK